MQKIPQSGHTDSQFISLSTLSAFYGDGNRLKIIETDAVKSLLLKDNDILWLKWSKVDTLNVRRIHASWKNDLQRRRRTILSGF